MDKKEIDEETTYLKYVHNAYKDNYTALFTVQKFILPLTRFLIRGSKASLYLDNDDFRTLYPVLRDHVLNENDVTLILHHSIIDEMKNYPELPFIVDPNQKEIPSPSNLLNKKNIFVSNEEGIPSFMLFNHRSYLIKVNDETSNYFLCELTAPLSSKQAERLDMYYRAMSALKENSIPFLEIEPKKITSHHISPNEIIKNINSQNIYS